MLENIIETLLNRGMRQRTAETRAW